MSDQHGHRLSKDSASASPHVQATVVWGNSQWEEFKTFLIRQLTDLMDALMHPHKVQESLREQSLSRRAGTAYTRQLGPASRQVHLLACVSVSVAHGVACASDKICRKLVLALQSAQLQVAGRTWSLCL